MNKIIIYPEELIRNYLKKEYALIEIDSRQYNDSDVIIIWADQAIYSILNSKERMDSIIEAIYDKKEGLIFDNMVAMHIYNVFDYSNYIGYKVYGGLSEILENDYIFRSILSSYKKLFGHEQYEVDYLTNNNNTCYCIEDGYYTKDKNNWYFVKNNGSKNIISRYINLDFIKEYNLNIKKIMSQIDKYIKIDNNIKLIKTKNNIEFVDIVTNKYIAAIFENNRTIDNIDFTSYKIVPRNKKLFSKYIKNILNMFADIQNKELVEQKKD